MKILSVPDIHGRHEALQNAIDRFEKEKYDLIVLTGDYVDSYNRTDEDIFRTVKLILDLKEKYPTKVILLLGNHDISYRYYPQFMCSGFRLHNQQVLTALFTNNKQHFQIAYQIGDFLFTHAGICKGWYRKYEPVINKHYQLLGIDKADRFGNLGLVLNSIHNSEDFVILHEVGVPRGGMTYDIGGLTWCDQKEMENYGPLPGYKQIVGHTPQVKINTFEVSDETSVTFTDVLSTQEDFLTLII